MMLSIPIHCRLATPKEVTDETCSALKSQRYWITQIPRRRDAMTVTRERLPEVLGLATTALLRHFSMGGGSHGWSSDRVRSRLGADRAMMTDADKERAIRLGGPDRIF